MNARLPAKVHAAALRALMETGTQLYLKRRPAKWPDHTEEQHLKACRPVAKAAMEEAAVLLRQAFYQLAEVEQSKLAEAYEADRKEQRASRERLQNLARQDDC